VLPLVVSELHNGQHATTDDQDDDYDATILFRTKRSHLR